MSRPRRRLTYRARRRLLWASVTAAFIGAMLLTAVFFWNTAPPEPERTGGRASVFVAPKKTKLTPAERKEIVAVAQLFVDAAVGRDHPERAYDVVGPLLKGDLTRDDWKSGNIPVVPFASDAARWSIEYSNAESVGLRVMLLSDNGPAIGAAEFALRVVGVGTGAKRHWIIDGWTPRGGGSTRDVGASSESAAGAFAASGYERVSTRASTWWLLAPFVLLACGLVVPVVMWARERRAVRRVRKAMG
jgi:hypothetical protein